ncbi:PREDICTED: transcription factor A, mitochondrial [Nicrophorus vespilloides]|uniref:Transcription factor A, mitochondrial n=1 Tax=Nicrophorus vespilloides TaxID=110193 RepID=A0ABM1N6W8_NICVS|nr:PREDICTED: transcription factor A, mitochondrial [Nicrophorus vespilloides]
MSGQLLKLFNSFGGFKNILQTRSVLVGYQQNATMKHSAADKLKELNMPEKPKRPLTPYFRFMRDCREEYMRKNPDMKNTELTKVLALDWMNVHETIKEKYSDEYKSELDNYNKQHLIYLSKLSDEQKLAIKTAIKEQKDIKKKRHMKKRFREMNRPKRPLGPYMQFLMEYARKSNMNMKEVISSIKGKYQQLSESEKEVYVMRYEEAKARYEKEMVEWEAKMIEEGHVDVIRQIAQKENKPSRLRSKAKEE